MRFHHVHDSGRFDRDPVLLRRDVRRWRDSASLVTRTEIAREIREETLRGPGWSYFSAGAGDGADECSVEWSNDRWAHVGDSRSVQLSKLTYTRTERYGGGEAPPTHAAVVRLVANAQPNRYRLCVLAVHMPVPNTPRRLEVYADTARGLVRLIKAERSQNPGARLLVAGDWNYDHREPIQRRILQDLIAGPAKLQQAWDVTRPATGGTMRNRLIDGDLTDCQVLRAELLPDTVASDHRAYRTQLVIPDPIRRSG